MSAVLDVERIAADWIAREDRANWSEDYAEELERWLEADTAHRVAYLRLRNAWDRADRLSVLGAGASPSTDRASPIALHARRSFPARRIYPPIVAGLAGLSLAGVLILSTAPGRSGKTYATRLGGRETVSFTDGTKVLLNTDTKLRADIGSKARVVHLDYGEAFFDVRHDAAHPFIVIAGNRRITDVGTKFSVRIDGDKVKVVVAEGRVDVETIGDPVAPAVSLTPAVVARGGVAVAEDKLVLVAQQSDAQVARDLAWREGVLNFNQTTLHDAAEEFNRYNEEKLVVQDGAAANLRIDGSFRSNNVGSFANLLRDGFGLKVEDRGDEILVSE